MGVFKEHANAFETLAKKQSRIYNDACDYGVSYNKKNPPKEVQAVIHFVKDLKGSSLIKNRIIHPQGVTTIIRIGWEMDEGKERGTQYTIAYNEISGISRINRNHNACIMIDIKNYHGKN